MILGFHLIYTAYGFWLPNDPRGSWSDFVRSWDLLRYGPATKTSTRRSVAQRRHDRREREEAKTALRYPPVIFNGYQALAIASGIEQAIRDSGYVVHACAILPDHVHMVIAWHATDAHVIIGHFKRCATMKLFEAGLHPFQHLGKPPSAWAHKGWPVFLDSIEDMRRAIRYVEGNPEKEGLRRQHWRFITPYVPPI